MTNFFSFLETYRTGILITLLCLAFFALVVQWFAWIFSFGRFNRDAAPGALSPSAAKQNLRYIISDAIIKIVNDFRHLLALIIIAIFAIALCNTLFRSGDIATAKEALQAVMATLGGLVGSIIGYYFGESAVIKARESENPADPARGTTTGTVAIQSETIPTSLPPAPITDAPSPPPVASPPDGPDI